MTIVLIGLLWILLRSLALSLAVVTSMGRFGLDIRRDGMGGIALNAVTTVTPSVVFAIGVLDGVHLAAHYKQRCWERSVPDVEARRQILLSRARAGPCVLNSLTIMGAFLAFLLRASQRSPSSTCSAWGSGSPWC
jgi:predicted RND superfamily exporter protein